MNQFYYAFAGLHLHHRHLRVRDPRHLRTGQILTQPVGGATQLYQGSRGVHKSGQSYS
jgi:hypothetical protein